MAKIKRNWYNYYRGSKKLRKARMVQTDNAKVTIKTSQVVTANYDENNRTGVAAINIYDVLASNPLFNSQKANYDQVKINYVSAKITCTDVGTSLSNANSVKSYNVYTAWDRTGLSLDQFLCFPSTSGGNTDRWITKVGNYIANYSSSQKKALNSFQRFTESQYIAPNDMMERCCYVSTGDIVKFSGSQFVNENSLPREILIGMTDANALLTIPFVTTPNENPNCRWKPTLLIGVFSNSLPDAQSQVSVVNEFGSAAKCVFNVDFSINVTFRGLKASLYRVEDQSPDENKALQVYSRLPVNISPNYNDIVVANASDQIPTQVANAVQFSDGTSKVIDYLNLNNVKCLAVYNNNSSISSNGIHEINFMSSVGMPVTGYRVNVNVPTGSAVNLQQKTVTVSQNGTSTITADTGYQGLESVELVTNVPTPQPVLESKTVELQSSYAYYPVGPVSETIVPSTGYDGFSSVTYAITPLLCEQSKTYSISSNGTYTINPTEGYNIMQSASITVNVPASALAPKFTKFANTTTYAVLERTWTHNVNATNVSVSVPTNSAILVLKYMYSNTRLYVYYYWNSGPNDYTAIVPGESYYNIVYTGGANFYIKNNSDENIFQTACYEESDIYKALVILNYTTIDFVLPGELTTN